MSYQSIFRPGLFDGKSVIITGGGSGIGRCTAHELAALGAYVILVGRNPDKLNSVAAEIGEDGGKADTQTCDIRDEDAVKAAVGEIAKKHPHVAGLVNNAGGQFPAPLATINQKGWETVVRTNLTGGFLMAKEVLLQTMATKGGGSIVNIVADMWRGMPGMGHSGAARAGMVNFTQTAAVEWASMGVRVNAVAPGWIQSSGFDTYDGPVKSMIKNLDQHLPARRLGREAEISGAICFLLSDAAAFITGDTLKIDGGAPLGSPLMPIPKHNKLPPFEGFHRAIKPDVLKEGED